MLDERKGASDEVEQWPLLEEDALGPRWLCRNYPEALNLDFDECLMVCNLVYKVITFQQRKQTQILTKQISREKNVFC